MIRNLTAPVAPFRPLKISSPGRGAAAPRHDISPDTHPRMNLQYAAHYQYLVFGALAAAIPILALLKLLLRDRRKRAMKALAAQLRLQYQDYNAVVHRQFDFLAAVRKNATDEFCENILGGRLGNLRVLAFDYHCTTGRGKDKATHRATIMLLQLERPFPGLALGPEGLLGGFAGLSGCGDIDFESIEFSRTFRVSCMDRKFAYDFCNPRMMELLLGHPQLQLEVARDWIAVHTDGLLAPQKMVKGLYLLQGIRERMPEYLFAQEDMGVNVAWTQS
mgnify:CR=1 FL=1